jgi:Domain of unknown function DUF11
MLKIFRNRSSAVVRVIALALVGASMSAAAFATPNLKLTKSDGPDPVAAGNTLTYTLTVDCKADDAPGLITLTDPLPAGVTFLSASGPGWTCGESMGTVTCTFPSMVQNQSATVTIQVTAPGTAGLLSNTATVLTSPIDLGPGNNVKTETTAVVAAGFTVTPTSGLGTTEVGGTATFTVALNAPPDAGKTVVASSLSSDSTEGVATPASLVAFTVANWNVAQTVTVTGQNDTADDGDIPYTIVNTFTTDDVAYGLLDPDTAVADVTATNIDNDPVAITVTPNSPPLVTTEAGGTATFDVVLSSQPAADVVINLSSDDTSEGTVPASITFMNGNGTTPQTVTITGQNDDIDDGDVAYNILTSVTSTDIDYAAIDPDNVAVTNNDDGDTAGITVTPNATPLITTEDGGTDSFDVVLTSEPTDNVQIDLLSSDTTEGSLPASIVFTNADWDTPQTVTVTGVDDLLTDGNIGYSIQTGTTSNDAVYDAIDPADVAATNNDNAPEGTFYSVTPCRILDTRSTPVGGGPLSNGQIRVYGFAACPIPDTALAASLNVTAAEATGSGEFNLFSADIADGSAPGTVVLHFRTGLNRANNAIVDLSDTLEEFKAKALLPGGGTVQLIIDINGYFE